MLHDLDRTFEKLLREDGKIAKGDVDISFDQPTSEWSAKLNRPTINFWCFDLRENLKLRSTTRQVNRNGGQAQISMPTRRIDLSYFVTAWARKVEDERRLLWRALATFKRYPTELPVDRAEGDLRYQQRNMPFKVADMTETHMSISDLWSVLDNQMRLGFMITVTVELDIEMEMQVPLVLESTIRVGQAEAPPSEEMTSLDTEIRHSADRKEAPE